MDVVLRLTRTSLAKLTRRNTQVGLPGSCEGAPFISDGLRNLLNDSEGILVPQRKKCRLFFFLCGLCFALTGYGCPQANCQVVEHTWGKLRKHMAKHQGESWLVNCTIKDQKPGEIHYSKRESHQMTQLIQIQRLFAAYVQQIMKAEARNWISAE